MGYVIAISLGISFFGLYGIARYYHTAKNSEDWPRVHGKLLKCELIQREEDNHAVFDLGVKYSYRVDHETYESAEIMFYFPRWSRWHPYEEIQRKLTGTNSLVVYVNPRDPRQSVLFPGADHVPTGLLAIASIMMVVCPISGALAIYHLLLAS